MVQQLLRFCGSLTLRPQLVEKTSRGSLLYSRLPCDTGTKPLITGHFVKAATLGIRLRGSRRGKSHRVTAVGVCERLESDNTNRNLLLLCSRMSSHQPVGRVTAKKDMKGNGGTSKACFSVSPSQQLFQSSRQSVSALVLVEDLCE